MAGEKLIQKALQAAKAAHAKRYIADPLERDINLGKFLQGTKTVNDEGDLFKLYHITKGDISEFIPGGPSAPNLQPSGPAIWLSANPEYLPATHNVGYPGEYAAGTNVMPLWASMKNPLVVEKGFSEQKYGSGFPFAISPEGRDKLIADGYDSVINRITQSGQEEYLALHPNQVKSATGNAGTFDPTSPRIEENRGGSVDAALHAVRHHLAGGGFLSDLFSGPDYLSTGEVASPMNWGDPESAADFFKADRALRLAREVQAKEPEAAPPRQVQERAPVEAVPRQQIASPPPAPAFRPVQTLPGDTVEPHDFPPVTTPSLVFGEPVYGEKTQRLGGGEDQNKAPAVQMDYTIGNAGALWPSSGNDIQTYAGIVPEDFNEGIGNPMSVDDVRQSMMFRPEPRAEISRAVSLAQNLAPAQPETIPDFNTALANVEKLHNAGVYSGEALDKAGEMLGAHLRARDAGIPVDEALRLIRAEGPRMVNQGMPSEERPVVQPLAYTATPASAPAAAAIDQATGKLTARMPEEPNGIPLTRKQADYIARTIATESSGDPEESRAIAHVILNRINSGNFGNGPEGVLFAKNQFEPWTNPSGKNYPLKVSPTSAKYLSAQEALESALAGKDITGGALNFWGPGSQYGLGRDTPDWALKMPDYTDIGATRFHRPNRASGGLVDDALHVVRERHADGEAVGQAPVATDNSERVQAADRAAELAKQIQAYEASMASIRQQPQDIQSMTHAPEKPRAPISVEALGKNREFGSAPYDVAGPLSTLAQGAYDMKTMPLYMYPPTAPLGMAIDTAEGVASGSPTQVAMGALGGPLKVARNVIAPLAVATGVTAPDEAEAGNVQRALKLIRQTGPDLIKKDPAAAAANLSKYNLLGKEASTNVGDLEYKYSAKNDLVPWREITPEDIYKQNGWVTSALGDKTPAGRMLHEINGVPLGGEIPNPVNQQGGGEFARSLEDPNAPWASRPGAVKGMHKKIEDARIEQNIPDDAPLFMSHTIMGNSAVDSTQMMAQSMLRQIEPLRSKISGLEAEKFDKFVGSKLPGWPGILNPRQAEAFMAADKTGTRASTLVQAFDKAGPQSGGFPNLGAARFANMDPRLVSADQLSSGFSIGRIDPRFIGPMERSHETYDMPFRGEYVGGMRYQVPAELMFPEWWKSGKLVDKNGTPTTMTNRQQALMTQMPVQRADQQWLDNIMRYLETNKRKWGYYRGGITW